MTLFFAALGTTLFALLLLGHRRRARSIVHPPIPEAKYARYPSITVIRPIRGLDAGCRLNTLALLEQDYPGKRQTLFVFDSDNDPAWSIVWGQVRSHAETCDARVLVAGAPPSQRTGKLNAMMFGLEQAEGELIAFSDSDTRPSPQLLRLLVEAVMDDPGTGASFAPIVTAAQPQSAGEAGVALLVNSWYGAAADEAATRGAMPFLMGELFVCTRRALHLIGGLRAAEGQLVDDMHLGKCLVKAGLKNTMVPWQLPVVTGRIGFAEFLKVFRRWMIFSKAGLPSSFVGPSWLRGLEYTLAVIATLAALALKAPVGAVFPLAAAALFVWSDRALQQQFSGHRLPGRHWWVSAALPFIGAAFSLGMKLNPRVVWRGRTYLLDGGARLAAPQPQPLHPHLRQMW